MFHTQHRSKTETYSVNRKIKHSDTIDNFIQHHKQNMFTVMSCTTFLLFYSTYVLLLEAHCSLSIPALCPWHPCAALIFQTAFVSFLKWNSFGRPSHSCLLGLDGHVARDSHLQQISKVDQSKSTEQLFGVFWHVQ